jgi:outer membrane protein assembly factor BamB
MKTKIIIFSICMLMVFTAIFPAAGNTTTNKNLNTKEIKETYVGSEEDWWRMRSHDSQRTGFSNSFAPNTNHISWSYTSGEFIDLSSAAVVDNRLYIGTIGYYSRGEPRFKMLTLKERYDSQEKPSFSSKFNKNPESNSQMQSSQILCLDSNNGQYLWSTSLYGYAESSPAVVDDKVYLTTTDDYLEFGQIYCLNAITGDVLWQSSIGTPLFSSPAVYDGKVFITVFDWNYVAGRIICYNADDGNIIWSRTLSIFEYSWLASPVAAVGKVFITTWNEYTYAGRVHCYDADDGTTIWSKPYYMVIPDYATSAYKDGKLYVPVFDYNSENGRLLCLNADDGNNIWSYHFGSWEYCYVSSPSFGYGNVYVATNDDLQYTGPIYCLNANDGNLIWENTVDDWPFTSPAVADSKIYLAYDIAGIKCYDALLGDLLWDYSIGNCYSSPAITNGHLYVATTNGDIYAFEDALIIDKIMGGILNAKIIILNDGDSVLNDISWTIHVTGGTLIPVDKYAEGTIPRLEAGISKLKIVFPVFGLGKIKIKATATIPGLTSIKKEVDGFALGPLIIV